MGGPVVAGAHPTALLLEVQVETVVLLAAVEAAEAQATTPSTVVTVETVATVPASL